MDLCFFNCGQYALFKPIEFEGFRNKKRFPDDFRFKLTIKEYDALRSQIVTLNNPKLVSQTVTPSKPYFGGALIKR
jgi:hypothetical protein